MAKNKDGADWTYMSFIQSIMVDGIKEFDLAIQEEYKTLYNEAEAVRFFVRWHGQILKHARRKLILSSREGNLL